MSDEQSDELTVDGVDARCDDATADGEGERAHTAGGDGLVRRGDEHGPVFGPGSLSGVGRGVSGWRTTAQARRRVSPMRPKGGRGSQ